MDENSRNNQTPAMKTKVKTIDKTDANQVNPASNQNNGINSNGGKPIPNSGMPLIPL